MGTIRSAIRRVALRLTGGRILGLERRLQSGRFTSSADYWESRYARGGNSGAGSYGESARVKADFINRFVADNAIATVIELGCGDGAQLELAKYPQYVGYDISPTVVAQCRARFEQDPSKEFRVYEAEGYLEHYDGPSYELALSLDVAYHLVEDRVYRQHLEHLFASSSRYVIIYSTDIDMPAAASSAHVRHRPVVADALERISGWELTQRQIGVPASSTEPALEFLVFTAKT